MAIYVPNTVNETMNALNTLAVQMDRDRKRNIQAGQVQLQELARLGIGNEDPRTVAALNAITTGGNPLAMLFKGQAIDPMTSALGGQQGQQVQRQGQQAQQGQPQGQPRVTSKLSEFLSSAQGKEETGTQGVSEKGLLLQEDIRTGREDLENVSGALSALGQPREEDQDNVSGITDSALAAGLGGVESDTDAAEREMDADLRGDLTTEKGMTENRLSDAMERLDKSEYWSPSSRKNIKEGKYYIKDKGKWRMMTDKDVEPQKIEQDTEKVFQTENQQLRESVRIGGPLTGTETQMRAKTRNDFKTLFNQAGSIEEKRQIYDDYTSTMKSIDDRFRRKQRYLPFERAYTSLFRQTKPTGRSSGGGGGGSYSDGVIVTLKDGKTLEIPNINAKTREQAYELIKKKYPDKDISIEDVYGKTKKTARGLNFDISMINRQAERRAKSFTESEKERKVAEFDKQKALTTLRESYNSVLPVGYKDSILKSAWEKITGRGMSPGMRYSVDNSDKLTKIIQRGDVKTVESLFNKLAELEAGGRNPNEAVALVEKHGFSSTAGPQQKGRKADLK